MPTKNPRVNVVLEPVLHSALKKMAHLERVSISLKARDLIGEALELHEDIYWDKIADARMKTFDRAKALTHEEVWK